MSEVVSQLSGLYSLLGISQTPNAGDLAGFLVLLFLLLTSLGMLLRKGGKELPPAEKAPEEEAKEEVKEELEKEAPEAVAKKEIEEKVEEKVEEKKPTLSWRERLGQGLSRSRKEVWGRLGEIFGAGHKLDDETIEEVEEILYGADIGPKAAQEIIEQLEERSKDENWSAASFKKYIKDFLRERLAPYQEKQDPELFEFKPDSSKKTRVIMIVGVNGAGKTTTIGKLATKLTRQGAKVVVGACDTFRAAAVDQLEVWCERAGAEMIRAKEGSSPSGVGYDALQRALSEEADYCILDTAGRLHTKGNLMEELAKSKKVLKKLDETAPHHTLLVVDAITGQNAIRQAEEFDRALDLTGIILTKCDGSSKAGSAVSIVQSLQKPITYIGVGETVEDLNRFDLEDYLDALIGEE